MTFSCPKFVLPCFKSQTTTIIVPADLRGSSVCCTGHIDITTRIPTLVILRDWGCSGRLPRGRRSWRSSRWSICSQMPAPFVGHLQSKPHFQHSISIHWIPRQIHYSLCTLNWFVRTWPDDCLPRPWSSCNAAPNGSVCAWLHSAHLWLWKKSKRDNQMVCMNRLWHREWQLLCVGWIDPKTSLNWFRGRHHRPHSPYLFTDRSLMSFIANWCLFLTGCLIRWCWQVCFGLV